MLRIKIVLFGCFMLLSNVDGLESKINFQDKPAIFAIEANAFETAHKIQHQDVEFQTSHKISIPEKSRYLKMLRDDDGSAGSLMQLQQTQNLLSTKERPELNPILSALINEDVMKSIEAKRAIEQEQFDSLLAEASSAVTTESTRFVLTTVEPSKQDSSFEDDLNLGLIDQSISLDAAGSENNKKSRIQVRKGPNGMDYEYEYVYYYYDDDESASGKKQEEAESVLVEESSKKDANPQERGKSRYTNIDRSTTSAPDNVLVSGKAKGRANSPLVSDEVNDGRLPAITRFPSRGTNIVVQPTASLETVENTANALNEKSTKISVKRPSLELVDSETFNTDEKQVKGSPRNGDSEKLPISTTLNESPKLDATLDASTKQAEQNNEGQEPLPVEEVDQTTPLMEKAALDLYAILANENLEMDITTDMSKELTTDLPNTTESDEDGVTTFEEETVATVSASPSTTTTTTTVPSTTTSATTTNTAALSPLFGAGRRESAIAGKNRFRSKPGTTTVSLTSTTEATPEDPESFSGFKPRNRFNRPSFGNRNRASISPSQTPPTEDLIEKEKEKPVFSSNPSRGRNRNRFNIRGQSSTTSTTESSQAIDQNDEENQVLSTTARNLRGRPTLNLRGRSRLNSRPTSASHTPVTEDESAAVASVADDDEEKAHTSSLPSRPSRFNLNRVSGSGTTAGKRLLPRGRLNTSRSQATTAAAPVEVANNDSGNYVNEESNGENTSKPEVDTATTTSPVGGLKRLKNRPRLQLQPKTDTKLKAAPIPVRKVNPLLARRKLAFGSSTTEAASPAEDPSEEIGDNTSSTDGESLVKMEKHAIQDETQEVTAEDNTELPETTTKQARGLGLLAQRRRLPIRKPGTLL